MEAPPRAAEADSSDVASRPVGEDAAAAGDPTSPADASPAPGAPSERAPSTGGAAAGEAPPDAADAE